MGREQRRVQGLDYVALRLHSADSLFLRGAKEHWEQDINPSVFLTSFTQWFLGLKWVFLINRYRKSSCSVRNMSDHRQRVHEGPRRPAAEKFEVERHEMLSLTTCRYFLVKIKK